MSKKSPVESVDLRRWYFSIALHNFERWIEYYREVTADHITANDALRVMSRLELTINQKESHDLLRH